MFKITDWKEVITFLWFILAIGICFFGLTIIAVGGLMGIDFFSIGFKVALLGLVVGVFDLFVLLLFVLLEKLKRKKVCY